MQKPLNILMSRKLSHRHLPSPSPSPPHSQTQHHAHHHHHHQHHSHSSPQHHSPPPIHSSPNPNDLALPPHTYTPPLASAHRSPCPALNALANHSYIPHSGQSVGFWQLVLALRKVYNLSYGLALALTIAGFLCAARWSFLSRKKGGKGKGEVEPAKWGTLNLDQLTRHSGGWLPKLEHDGSLVHRDARGTWAPESVDPHMLASVVDHEGIYADADGEDVFDLDTLSRIRYERAQTLLEYDEEQKERRKLSALHSKLAFGEAALLFLTLSSNPSNSRDSPPSSPTSHTFLQLPFSSSDDLSKRTINRHDLHTWLGQERLPEGWTGNVSGERITLSKVHKVAGIVKEGTDRITKRMGRGQEEKM